MPQTFTFGFLFQEIYISTSFNMRIVSRKNLKGVKRANSLLGIPNHNQECNCIQRHHNNSYIWGCYYTITNHATNIHKGTASTVYFRKNCCCQSLLYDQRDSCQNLVGDIEGWGCRIYYDRCIYKHCLVWHTYMH